ncbi:MAG: site-specific integrase [Candidatus Aenigmarchaeota archaeon]|nr:site-specific integrase [Candidatus Aenigmarchaeota archaeon]MDW8149239.1 site-specific integrase [Candidatus Aenigmarchaeota archaeon]
MLEKFESFRNLCGEIDLLTRSENTKKTYEKGLMAFMKIFEIDDLDKFINKVRNGEIIPNEVYKQFLLNLAKKQTAPKTILTWSSALKKFFEANSIKIDEKIRIKVFNIHEDHLISKEELRFIVNNVNIRTQSIILILSSSGLRIDELRNLKIGDVDLKSEPAVIKVRGSLAKERKPRVTFISKQAKEVLLKYLSTRKNVDNDSYLITSREEKQLSYSQIQYIINKAFKLIAKKEGKRYNLHAHVLRKFFKTNMIAAGVPAPIVDRLMGHKRYLSEEYELYTFDQLKEWYLKGEANLTL